MLEAPKRSARAGNTVTGEAKESPVRNNVISAVWVDRFHRRLRVTYCSDSSREEVVSSPAPFIRFGKSLDSEVGVYNCMNAVPSGTPAG